MPSPRSAAPAYSRAHPYAAGPSHRHSHTHTQHRRRSPGPIDELPPSPPRSRRDGDSPPAAKQAASDHNDNYWDDVVSILSVVVFHF